MVKLFQMMKVFLLNGKQVKVTRKGPGEWEWGDLGVDIVLETTGKFRDRESCEKHLACGAKKGPYWSSRKKILISPL